MNIKKLLDTIKCNTDTLYWNLIQELKELGMKPEYNYDDWIYVNNSSPIMLVAHIDTVTRNRKLKFRVKHNRISARNSVLGADDRAGIYAIMEILNLCKTTGTPMPSILFTNYEESGLIGVNVFIDAKVMEKNMNLFIELDRRGSNEYVYYDFIMPKEVKSYIESFGYTSHIGSMSDVLSLTEEYKVPHVNLSVGYYNQHTENEYLVPSELDWTIKQVFGMVQNPIQELYDAKPDLYYSRYTYNYQHDDYYNYNRNETNPFSTVDNLIPCDIDYTPIQLKYYYSSDYIANMPYIEEYEDVIYNETEFRSDKGIYDFTEEEWQNAYGYY